MVWSGRDYVTRRVFYLVVFHWSLSDIKSSQISSTLLSIIVDIEHILFWLTSIQLPILNSSSSFSTSLRTFSSELISVGINVTLMFLNFLVLRQSQSIFIFFHFLWFLFYCLPGQQNQLFYRFSFFVNYY